MLYNHANVRNPDQAEHMLSLEAANECLFCDPDLVRHRKNTLFFESEHWRVVDNAFPYHNTKLHLMLIPTSHVSDMVDLSEEAQLDFWNVLKWCHDNWNLTYYGLGSRNGDFYATGATIAHLHLHLIVGDVHDENHKSVSFKMSAPYQQVAN